MSLPVKRQTELISNFLARFKIFSSDWNLILPGIKLSFYSGLVDEIFDIKTLFGSFCGNLVIMKSTYAESSCTSIPLRLKTRTVKSTNK